MHGVSYLYQGHQIKTYFTNPKAKLPVKSRNGDILLLPWGRRPDQPGNLPLGGVARLETIHEGRWNKYFPKAVKIPLQEFMEKDIEGKNHWFPITEGQWVQGLAAHYDQEIRVYTVGLTPQMENALYERWPRIMAG